MVKRRHASVCYTLTLPVSRDRLIWTHQSRRNWVAAVVRGCPDVGRSLRDSLVARGVAFPFVPLAVSIAFGTLFLIAWIALLGALTLVMHEVLGYRWRPFPVYVFSIPWVIGQPS